MTKYLTTKSCINGEDHDLQPYQHFETTGWFCECVSCGMLFTLINQEQCQALGIKISPKQTKLQS